MAEFRIELSGDPPTVRLELMSRLETVTLVRAVLGGLAERLAVDPELLDDIKTAVSEACNNVVLHAYEDGIGPLSLSLYVSADTIEVIVRDRGKGVSDLVPADERRQGVGLQVIRVLAEQAEFLQREGGGTEVWMAFLGQRDGKRLFERLANPAPEDIWARQLAGDAVVSVSPVAVLNGVLGRLARAMAASARFSLDRFSDVYLVTDAIAAHAEAAASHDRVGFGITAHPRRLALTIGPFVLGSGKRLRDDSNVGASPLVRLSDEVDVEAGDHSEQLHVVLVDHRR